MSEWSDYHPDEDVVTIYLASPEQSTALNLEQAKNELTNLLQAIERVKQEYDSR